MIQAQRKIQSISAMIGPFTAVSSLIEWQPSQGQAGAKSYFLLTCAASRPQNLHTNCLYTGELSKQRSSSLIFLAGNMKRNLFACRKGHKGMSNMISGNLATARKDIRNVVCRSAPRAESYPPIVSLSEQTDV